MQQRAQLKLEPAIFMDGITKKVEVIDDKAFALWSLCNFGIAPIKDKATIKWLQSEFKDLVTIDEPVHDDYLNKHWIARCDSMMLVSARVRWEHPLNFRYSLVIRLPTKQTFNNARPQEKELAK